MFPILLQVLTKITCRKSQVRMDVWSKIASHTQTFFSIFLHSFATHLLVQTTRRFRVSKLPLGIPGRWWKTSRPQWIVKCVWRRRRRALSAEISLRPCRKCRHIFVGRRGGSKFVQYSAGWDTTTTTSGENGAITLSRVDACDMRLSLVERLLKNACCLVVG